MLELKRSLAGCVVAGALVAAQGAVAADLSLAPLYKAPPPTPAFDWSGFYLGVNGGGGWGHSWWSGQGAGVGLSGGQVGGTVGYNYQVGKVVFGAEGDLDWTRFDGTSNSTQCPGCSTNDSWLSTVRGRIGYSFDRVMPYVTGGLAVGDINAAAPTGTGSAANAGWALGAGFEVALPGNWSAKAEYLRVDLGHFDCGGACGVTPTDNVSLNENVFRAGVNYHFGWGK
jgi:outer membrane immunogenic protein